MWLQLHRLSGCLEAEGDTRHERLKKILAAWEVMPRLARVQVAGELAHLLTELPELRLLPQRRGVPSYRGAARTVAGQTVTVWAEGQVADVTRAPSKN